MISIFDRDANLIAWFNNNATRLFDTDMNWLAYVAGGHLLYARACSMRGDVSKWILAR